MTSALFIVLFFIAFIILLSLDANTQNVRRAAAAENERLQNVIEKSHRAHYKSLVELKKQIDVLQATVAKLSKDS